MVKYDAFLKFLLVFVVFFSLRSVSFGLESTEVLVVANKKMVGSVDIAKYYMRKRNIPKSHLLSLSLSVKEIMSRKEYDEVLSISIVSALWKLRDKGPITTIVLIHGVPLKVSPAIPNKNEMQRIHAYRKEVSEIRKNSGNRSDHQKKRLDEKIKELLKTSERASVDSELSLVKVGGYRLDGWIKNPYFLGFEGEFLEVNKEEVLLVSRLDGPDTATVYRIINDSIEAEEKGLLGKAYLDARWPRPKSAKGLSAYRLYDVSLHDAAKVISRHLEVVVDENEELFKPQSCPKAALYCGWYSLARYIDSFDWQTGAVGYHIASSECSTLRDPKSSVWCLKMLEKGVSATIGPVFEPYVQGFPPPQMFFSQLVGGGVSLGEAYMSTLPYLSRQMVLIGDPLYKPFSGQQYVHSNK